MTQFPDRPSKEGLRRYRHLKGFYFDGISCTAQCPDPAAENRQGERGSAVL